LACRRGRRTRLPATPPTASECTWPTAASPATDASGRAATITAKTELPFEGFKQQLRDPVRVMPAYSEAVLSDKEAADIFAFVKTLPGRRPVKDVPLLNN
jgi:hypothetical protein